VSSLEHIFEEKKKVTDNCALFTLLLVILQFAPGNTICIGFYFIYLFLLYSPSSHTCDIRHIKFTTYYLCFIKY